MRKPILSNSIQQTLPKEARMHVSHKRPMYSYDNFSQHIPVDIDTSFGHELQKSDSPQCKLHDYLRETNSISLYTDGSKIIGSTSVGSAFSCPKHGIAKTYSINKNAPIYTAECIAIEKALHYVLSNKSADNNFLIISDSLSVLIAFKHPKNTIKTSHYIYSIRDKMKKLPTNFSVSFLWVPSHTGITGNDIADKLAKKATESLPEIERLPYTDMKGLIKKRINLENYKQIKDLGKYKGITYFELFHNRKSKPWFYG